MSDAPLARRRRAPRAPLALLVLLGLLGVSGIAGGPFGQRAAFAAQVRIFQTQTAGGFLAGRLDGVSVDAQGRLQLAPHAARLAGVEEPFLFAAAATPNGWVAGTGNSGKVLAIDRHGAVKQLLAAAEPEVFAVWADPDGTVFAGTSPHGKVYRIANGRSEVFFDPGETYIWALARAADGALLVATGTQGKLFRVTGKGQGEVLYQLDDTHLRSLARLPDGSIVVGTAGEGLILRLGRDGRMQTLFDAEEPEVVALAAAPDGTCYAAVIASEASLVDLAKETGAAGGNAAPAAAKAGAQAKASAAVAQEAAASETAASGRKAGAGPRSEVLRISPQGVVESVWSFSNETIYSLLWQEGRLWIGTGQEGKLYTWNGSQLLLARQSDERQVVALMPEEKGLAFATTNGAALYRVGAGMERKGTYTSAPLDAGQLAQFGTFRFRGEVPDGASLSFSFRTGISAHPDRTWTAWISPPKPAATAGLSDRLAATAGGSDQLAAPGRATAGGSDKPAATAGGSRAAGAEVSLVGLPRGRYVQWRAELAAGGAGEDHGEARVSPRIYGTELSYRQENLAPRITGFQALEPGQILVPANFNPGNQVYEPAHPNREGIFTSLEPASPEETRLKPLWKLGYRTLRWTASDPNEDPLVFELDFRPADTRGGSEGPWIKLADHLEEDHYSFDATALPDGIYRFRLIASDKPGNEAETALTSERVSEPVVVDHTPPALVGVVREGALLKVTVSDAASPIRDAVYSVNAKEWKPARPADGLLDGLTETLVIDTSAAQVKKGDLLLLRVTDSSFNVVSYDLSGKL